MLKKFIQSALLLVVLCTTATTYAQIGQSPEGIQFQALATDANGHPAAGRVIYVKDAIVAKTATGTIVYSETFKVTASSAGIFTIVLGKGTYASGVSSIANIDWANGPFFLNLKIAVEPTIPNAGWNANNEYVDLGTSQFWSVPYALYAGNVKGADGKLNTSDTAAMLKPYFTSINLKANIESPTFTGTVSGITKAMVGLGNVDNTADLNKPVSTATQTALDLKANAADVTTSLATKVDKVTGKELSTNDYTTAEKTKLAAITGTNTGDQDLSALAIASNVNTALGLKANTADVTTSLATKVDKVTGKELSTNDYTTAEKTKLTAITGTNTGDQDLSALAVAANVSSALAIKANAADVTTSLATKVDKVTGKDLSTNDYTTAEKTKLAAITGTNTGDQDLSALATNSALALKANATDVTTALDLKVDKVSGKALSTNDYTTAEKTKLAAITGTNTGDQDLSALAVAANVSSALAIKANAADVTTSLATKVDKAVGKDLSTNDYTTAEKDKLAAITGTNTGDQVNITGNAATATKLLTSVTINGIVFDGSANITLPTPSSGIPYTGATQALDLGAFDLKVNGLTIGKGNRNQENTAIGFEALKNNLNGNNNVAVGRLSLNKNTSGIRNTSIGDGALFENTTGADNTAVGQQALYSNQTSRFNTAIGRDALANNNQDNNTALGYRSAFYNTSGTNNTAVGHQALWKNNSGSKNTAVGGESGFDNPNNFSNTTAIGYEAKVAASNTIQLGADGTGATAAITNVKTSGTLTAGTVTYPNAHNSTAGQVLTTNVSGVASWATPASSSSATYSIGLNAELGGYVVYVGEGSQHGLVVATQDQGSATNDWYSVQNTVSDPTNHNISGKKFTDWRLPTLYELTTYLFFRRAAIGGFDVTSSYWSSTEFNATDARYVFFGNNFIGNQSKIGSQALKIRAVRSF